MINLLLFFQETNLKKHLKSQDGEFTVVTPSSSHADMMRNFLDSEQRFNVVTISNFIQTQFEELFEADIREKKKGKSDLLLILGSLWRLFNKESGYDFFERSFELLTDFRAFSMNIDVLETILENYPDELRESTLLGHKILDELDIIDEHKSYFLLAQKLREGNLPILYESEKNYIFYGFDFLTPAQIDLLNAVAIRNNVYIPFYSSVYEKSTDLDWIKWITRFDTKVIHIDEKEELTDKKNLELISFSKNRLSQFIQAEQNSNADILIASKNKDLNNICELPFKNLAYKVPLDLIKGEVKDLEQYLLNSIAGNELSSSEFEKLIKELFDLALKEKNFKKVKAITLLESTFNKWKDLSDKNEEISLFEIKLFIEILSLDSPRNSLINGIDGERVILTLKELDKVNSEKDLLVCISESYGPIKSSVVDYSDDVQKYLASIGPIRRSEFEFEILKNRIKNILSHTNCRLYLESGLIEHDLAWSEILSEYNLIDQSGHAQMNSNEFDYFKSKKASYELSSYSATKLQSYIECPQKFWSSYVLKQGVRVDLPGKVNLLELGQIEHLIIEKYLVLNSEYSEELHLKLIKDELSKRTIYDELYLYDIEREVLFLTKGIIVSLIDLRERYGCLFSFEQQLSSNKQIQGSIDLYIKGKQFNGIWDFKRGGGSIPSKKGLFEFDKVQLWFYLNHIKEKYPDFINDNFLWGYINLSEPDKSLMFSNNKDLISELKGIGNPFLSKTYFFDEKEFACFEEYKNLENEVIENIKNDRSFLAAPKNEGTCNFCHLKKVCSK